MKIKPCIPIQLPPKHLDWELIVPYLGDARESLARYDEILCATPAPILEILKWEESISTMREQNIHCKIEDALRFTFDQNIEKRRALVMQKIANAKEALDFTINWAEKKPLTLSFICRLHAILKKDGPNPKEIGKIRKRQNWIGEQGCPIEKAYFLPPKAFLLPGLLKNWQSYTRAKEEPLIQLAILFAQFLIIHPFMDGNGRVARHYIPAFLYKKKLLSKPFLFISPYIEKHLLQYLQKLFDISEKNDWESWIVYFLKGIAQRSDRMRGQVERLNELYSKVKQEEPFVHPVSFTKKKILTENPKGLFVFEALFEAIR